MAIQNPKPETRNQKWWSMVYGLWSMVCMFFLPQGIVFAQEEVIGLVKETLSVEECKNAGCALGDFFADALRESAGSYIGIIPAYLLKKSLPPGDITSSQLSQLTDYGDDTLVLVKIKGEKFKPLFEQSLELSSRDNINFLHVSGLRVTYDPQKKPGERVVLVEHLVPWFPWSMAAILFFPELAGVYAAYKPVKPKDVFTAATVKFIAYGPMGYYNVFGDKNIIKMFPVTLEQSLISFVKKQKTISYENEKRLIKILPAPEEEKEEKKL